MADTPPEAGPPHVVLPGVPDYCPAVPKGDLLHRFRAYVRGTRIANNGEVILTLGVDPEHKWAALPLTDVRSMMFVVEIFDPQPLVELEGPDYIRELEAVVRGEGRLEIAEVIDLTPKIVPPDFSFEDDDG